MKALNFFTCLICAALAAACGSATVAPKNHRADDAACSAPAAAGNYNCASDCNVAGYAPQCNSDADCTEGAQGRCIQATPATTAGPPAYCTYDRCSDDADCPSDQACSCHGSPYQGGFGNQCTKSNCRVDADCGSGEFCSPSPATDACASSLYGYYCHTKQDTCTNDSDCFQGVCAWDVVLLLWDCTGPLLNCQ